MAQAESRQTADLKEQNIVDAVITVAKIIVCAVVLAVSGDERPYKPLRVWVVVYLCVSVASLPLHYWHYRHLRKAAAQASSQAHSQTLLRNPSVGRLNSGSVKCFEWALDYFFLAWFIVGCVWIFSGKSSRPVAPCLYWLTLAFLIFYIAGYVLIFLIGSAICGCFALIFVVMLAHLYALKQGSDETGGAEPEPAAEDQTI